MKQMVHTKNYLCVNQIDLSSQATEYNNLVALRAGAEVVSVNLQVETASDASITADVNLGDKDGFFLNDVDIATTGGIHSSINTTITEDSVINIKLSSAPTKGLLTLRVVYFLPAKELVEY